MPTESVGLGTVHVGRPEDWTGDGAFIDERQCIETVQNALDVGYRHIDRAQSYGVEAAIAEAIERSDVPSEEVFVATKIGKRDLGYEDVIDAAHESRERLQTESIDLLYVHWPTGAYDPTETLAAFDQLVEDGVIERVGLSNFTPELLDEAIETLSADLYAHQIEMHPLLDQSELLERAREHGHYLVTYSPLARGAVIDDPVIREIAAKHDATSAQVSLAWVAQNDRVVPIPKASTQDHLQENFAASDLALDSADVERINALERSYRVIDFDDAPWNANG